MRKSLLKNTFFFHEVLKEAGFAFCVICLSEETWKPCCNMGMFQFAFSICGLFCHALVVLGDDPPLTCHVPVLRRVPCRSRMHAMISSEIICKQWVLENQYFFNYFMLDPDCFSKRKWNCAPDVFQSGIWILSILFGTDRRNMQTTSRKLVFYFCEFETSSTLYSIFWI